MGFEFVFSFLYYNFIINNKGVNGLKKIGIIGGCGHVGIPLGLALVSRGFEVKLIDVNRDCVDTINAKKLPFKEEGAQELLEKYIGKTLFATNDFSCIKDLDIVVFVTGTPVDEHHNPKVNEVLKVIKAYLPYMNKNQLIVLRSTIFPGVTEVVANMLEKEFKSAKLAFCPERILQGKGIEEIFTLPQLISATSDEAFVEASEIFSKIAPKIIRLEPKEAELAKLMTNTWRYLEFAIANQFYMMVESQGLDFYKILGALSEDYPRAKHFAKAGLAAGPCLFKDTMQLSAFYQNQFFLGQSAMLVNEGLPDFLVSQLEMKMGSLKNKKIALFGVSFKPNNDDTRESLSFKVKKQLEFKMAEVLVSDPYQTDSMPLEKALSECDGVILGVPHNEYLNLKIDKPFVDCWNVWGRGEK